jgi:hypothetical protein
MAITDETKAAVRRGISAGMTHREIATEYGMGLATISRIRHEDTYPPPKNNEKQIEYNGNAAFLSVSARLHFKSVEEILDYAEVDKNVWEPYRNIVNSWDVTIKDEAGNPKTVTNWQNKVWLRRKGPEVKALEELLAKIEHKAPLVPKIARLKISSDSKRQLEISILDPHLGLRCFRPGADTAWTPELCEQMVMTMVDELFKAAKPYSPFEDIVFPFGNDFVHSDNVFHTTTAGTPQPESDSWQEIYIRAEQLVLAMIDKMKQEARVKVIVVPGNHARQTEFSMGRLISAYFHNDKNVTVDASASPYKFHHYGVNLIGYEHGHSIRQQVRLAALMANECRDVWGQTLYREWHLGDQHRKGSSKPSMFEEQGVSVEFLPGLTPPNEWHRIKSYNWQKRAGMAFVWDKERGPIARLQININNYTGRIMGELK